MCGIAGYSRSTPTSIPRGLPFARTLAFAIESRGRHATGFGWAERADEDNVFYSKIKGPASKVSRRLPLTKNGMHTLMAHTRHATLGDPKVNENNHPIVHEHIVLTHNGRVDNHEDLVKLANVERIGEVDSFALPAMLSRQGELAADHPVDLLELVQGVAAIAWMDATENHVLHLARLSTRPLHVGWTRKGDLVYASTAEALRRTARLESVGIFDIESVPEGTYLRVEAGEIVDCRSFHVNHPPVVVAEDMPGKASAKPKAASATRHRTPVLPAFDADDLDWWAEYDRREDERRRERDAAFDRAMSEMTDDGIDWSNLAPRRGWKVNDEELF